MTNSIQYKVRYHLHNGWIFARIDRRIYQNEKHKMLFMFVLYEAITKSSTFITLTPSQLLGILNINNVTDTDVGTTVSKNY